MVSFEKLVSRNVAKMLSDELDLAGVKKGVDWVLEMAIVGGLGALILVSYTLFIFLKYSFGYSAGLGVVSAIIVIVLIYVYLEFKIEQRKNFVESVLPDYLQLTAANVRSGISLDKAMVLAARPEFGYFSDDVNQMERQLYAGETMQNALAALAGRYRSIQLKHTVRMVTQAMMYGGGMTDLLNQVAKDVRNQQLVQKEISGQLFMYSIFISFAALVGAPVLYALTTQMMTITNTVWAGILQQNPGGLPTVGVSFLRPSPPKITIAAYHNFALAAIVIIAGFGAFIISAISSGSIVRGVRYLPIFLILSIIIYLAVGNAIGGVFSSISGV